MDDTLVLTLQSERLWLAHIFYVHTDHLGTPSQDHCADRHT